MENINLVNQSFEEIDDLDSQNINGGIVIEALVCVATIAICWTVDSIVKKTTGKSVAEHACNAIGI